MIYSIGYSTRSLPEFLRELSRRDITQLWDVRSRPRSRNWPFNAPQIERWAEREGILYRQCGAVLGGRSGISVDDPVYIEMLAAIVRIGVSENLAIMCTEGDPAKCHRTYQIGAELLQRHSVSVRSILRSGGEEGIEQSISRSGRAI